MCSKMVALFFLLILRKDDELVRELYSYFRPKSTNKYPYKSRLNGACTLPKQGSFGEKCAELLSKINFLFAQK